MDNSTLPAAHTCPSSLSSTSNTGIELLFVEQSGDLPPHRVGHRHDIRSHVRRHVARNFKQHHKTGQPKTRTDRTLARLASRPPGTVSSELVFQHCQPNSSTAREVSLNTLFALEESPLSQDPTDTDSYYSNGYSESENKCKTCGAQLHGPIDITERIHATDEGANVRRRALKLHSPVEILGAGRIDPFLTYPLKKQDRWVHELIDLSELTDIHSTNTFSLEYN
jgi:hypothetical protein